MSLKVLSYLEVIADSHLVAEERRPPAQRELNAAHDHGDEGG